MAPATAFAAADGPPPSSILGPGAGLTPGMTVTSPNGQFTLVIQNDGNLVESTSGGTVVWQTNTTQANVYQPYAVMQTDGNFVSYDNLNASLFSSNTDGNPGAYLSLGDMGQLSVDSPTGVPLWEPGNLAPGTILAAGTSTPLPGGQYRLQIQTDGNLVEYTSANVAVWASGTQGTGTGNYAVMQTDGNLVVYSKSGRALWATNTSGNPGAFLTIGVLGQVAVESTSGMPLWEPGTLDSGAELTAGQSMILPGGQYRLQMQTDGNLVEYTSANVAVWASGTQGTGSGNYADMQTDGNLVVYNRTGGPLWASNTSGNPGAVLTLNVQGQLAIVSTSGASLWGPGLVLGAQAGVLGPSTWLNSGQSLLSMALPLGQQTQLVMQDNGDLVEYTSDGAMLWDSGTSGAGAYTDMQSDGNLVVYSASAVPLWASNTDGNPGAVLSLGVLGQLAVQSTSGAALWTTNVGAPGLPIAPTNVTAIGGNGVVPDATAVVSWSAPTPSVITPVWGYTVTSMPGGVTDFVSAPATTATVTGLTDGVSYTFQVAAVNSAGTGASSWPYSNAVTPRPQPVSPAAPSGLEAVPGNGQIATSWSPPVDNGGSTITGYVATATPGGAQVSVAGSTTSAMITGLTNGRSYTVTVTATNAIGTGPASQPSAPAVPAVAPLPTNATVAADTVPSDWSSYNYTTTESDWNSAETRLSRSTAPTVAVASTATGLGYIQSSMPIVAFGEVFVGSSTGYENAFTTGSLTKHWSTFLGTDGPGATCPGTYQYGVVSAPTAATVNGSTQVIYLSGGDSALYALNASTGAILWRTQLAAPPNDFSFVSPLLYDGALYTGVSSYGDCPLVQGQVFKINPLTGAIEATIDMAPNGCVGGGLWGSPSVDSAGHIFFATGTEVPDCTGSVDGVSGWQLETSVDEVDANLNLVGHWHLPESEQISDSDFASVPTIYNDPSASGSGQVVAIADKDGTVYAFDRQNLSAGPIWQTTIAVGGSDPAIEGSISPMAYDGTSLYVGGGETTISGQSCGASVRALNPATGAVEWAECFAQGPLIGAVTGANGVVVACVGQSVVGMNSANGGILFSDVVPGGRSCWSGASISNGSIFADDGGGTVAQLTPGG